MTGADRGQHMEMSCEDVAELAGLYVLDALETDERAAVRAHLVSCKKPHAEIAELGAVMPALAMSAEPIDAPAELKSRVMAAVAAEAQAARQVADPVRPAVQPGRYSVPSVESPSRPVVPDRGAWRIPAWASWGSAIAALLVLAVVGVWALGVQSRATQADERAAVLSNAIAAMSGPGSNVAILQDSMHPEASGFAAMASDGSAYLVMVGMPSAPAGKSYQAWYIGDAAPVSAGFLDVDQDGYGVFADDSAMAGTQVMALTLEPLGGSDQPTSDPFVVGELHPV